MSNFHVGQKVVCIAHIGRGNPPRCGEVLPRRGGIYIIRGFDPEGYDGFSIWIEEIVNMPHLYRWRDGTIRRQECSWDITHFRPVIERKTDISIFKRLLVPASKQKQVA